MMSKLIVADRLCPSSKSCSVCGHLKENLPLSERVFACENCHSRINRDLNAAVNLSRLAASWAESINACKSGEVHALWQSAGQVLPDEAGTEHQLGDALDG
jgi:transposase